MERKVGIMSHEGSLKRTAGPSRPCLSGTLSDRLWLKLSFSLLGSSLLDSTSDHWLLLFSQSLPETTYLR